MIQSSSSIIFHYASIEVLVVAFSIQQYVTKKMDIELQPVVSISSVVRFEYKEC
jgi:hypothetical protein